MLGDRLKVEQELRRQSDVAGKGLLDKLMKLQRRVDHLHAAALAGGTAGAAAAAGAVGGGGGGGGGAAVAGGAGAGLAHARSSIVSGALHLGMGTAKRTANVFRNVVSTVIRKTQSERGVDELDSELAAESPYLEEHSDVVTTNVVAVDSESGEEDDRGGPPIRAHVEHARDSRASSEASSLDDDGASVAGSRMDSASSVGSRRGARRDATRPGRGPPSEVALADARECMNERASEPVLQGVFNKSSRDDGKRYRFLWRKRFVVVGIGRFSWYAKQGDMHARGDRPLSELQRVECLDPSDVGKSNAFEVRHRAWRCRWHWRVVGGSC
jgi:hypothetical protein